MYRVFEHRDPVVPPSSSVPVPPVGPSSSVPVPPGGSSSPVSEPPVGPSSSVPVPPGGSSSPVSEPPVGPSSSIPEPPVGPSSSVPVPPGGSSIPVSEPPVGPSSSVIVPPGISSSSVVVPPSSTPPVVGGPTTDVIGGTFLGCVVDVDTSISASGRLLDGPAFTLVPDLTQERCLELCSTVSLNAPDAPYRYFAIEFGTDCRCGNNFRYTPISAPIEECNSQCPTSPNQSCGGTNRLSLFLAVSVPPPVSSTPASVSASLTISIPDSVSSTPFSTPAGVSSTPGSTPTGNPNPVLTIDFPGGNYSGCYEDVEGGTGPRLFNGPFQSQLDNMTQESCQTYCTIEAPLGPYKYFGIEFGRDCYCGNTFQHDAIPYDNTITSCNISCTGNSTQQCGGVNRISVYLNNDYISLPISQSDSVSIPVSTPVSSAVDSMPVSQATPTDSPVQTPVTPTSTRRPFPRPTFPARPPSEVGDGVDEPYFANQPYRGGQRPPPNGGRPGGNNGGQPRPRPTRTRPTATRRPWKPRPTQRPWEGGPVARAERRWFGLW